MVRKYVRVLENREINSMTGEVWSIHDVPNTWKSRVEAQVIADGYEFLDDGTAVPAVDEEEPATEAEA